MLLAQRLLTKPVSVAESSAITLFTYANSSSVSIVTPSSVVAGDLIFLYQASSNIFSTPAQVFPSGYTNVFNYTAFLSSVGLRYMAFYKIATALDAGSTVTGTNGSSNSKTMIIFRKTTGLVNSVSVSSINNQATSGDPSAQTVLSSLANTPAIAMGYYIQSASAGRTSSPAPTHLVPGPSTTSEIRVNIFNESPTNVTFDSGDGGGVNTLTSFYLQIT